MPLRPCGQDVELHSTYIFVRGGTLQAGTEAAPHQHTFRITLYGDRYTTPHFPIYGAKNLAMRGGLIALHGVPRTPVWTRLAATAAKGAKSITVRQPTDWQRGEWVVIAPSHYFFYEAERRQIQSVSPDGRTIHFKERLLHNHYGEIYTAAGRPPPPPAQVSAGVGKPPHGLGGCMWMPLVNGTGNSPVSGTADPRSSQTGQVIRGLR